MKEENVRSVYYVSSFIFYIFFFGTMHEIFCLLLIQRRCQSHNKGTVFNNYATERSEGKFVG